MSARVREAGDAGQAIDEAEALAERTLAMIDAKDVQWLRCTFSAGLLSTAARSGVRQ
jgi:hypothetical protein